MTSLSRQARWWISITGSLFLPFLFTSVFLVATQRLGPSWGDGGLGFIIAVLSGAACWFVAPVAQTPKLVVGVAYVFLMGALQVGYALAFVCGVYHSCP